MASTTSGAAAQGPGTTGDRARSSRTWRERPEVPDVQAVQQKLIALGFVPGHSNVNDGWADGRFEQPTADAVTRFQRKHLSGTQFHGQIWSDDWALLFSL